MGDPGRARSRGRKPVGVATPPAGPWDHAEDGDMKQGIHPKYAKTTITCVCGNVITTRTTLGGNITIEICSNCHPFFTGKQKLMDTEGRVERFRRKYGKS